MAVGLDGAGWLAGVRVHPDSREIRIHSADMATMIATNRGHMFDTDGWFNLGWIFYRKAVRDGRVFYCPAHKYYTHEAMWYYDPNATSWGRLVGGYAYRFGGGSEGLTNAADRADEYELVKRAHRGKVKGVRAVTSDYFGYPDGELRNWPHIKPYGIVVGWTDGHITYVPLRERDWLVIGGFSLSDAKVYMALFFRGFDRDDLSAARAAFGIQ